MHVLYSGIFSEQEQAGAILKVLIWLLHYKPGIHSLFSFSSVWTLSVFSGRTLIAVQSLSSTPVLFCPSARPCVSVSPSLSPPVFSGQSLWGPHIGT